MSPTEASVKIEVDAEGNTHPSHDMPASGLLATITVQVTKVQDEGAPNEEVGEPTDVVINLNEGEDPEVVAFHFCAENADVNYLQEISRGLVERVRVAYGD